MGPPGRRQQGLPCDPAVGGSQQALHQGVPSLRSDLYARDAGQACWTDPRKGHTRMWRMLLAHVKAAYAVELRERGLGGCRRDEPAQGA
jgi:hypothetical protein